ncbi:FAD-dependent oxidoreductase [Williamsia sp. MIQD14]|uniref:FAD-dependent oxidoreductase n=1 Tax=Williamsia sp. MIQD14 TaxID=3425703 RepID=UPI003D9FF6FA
MTSLWLQDRSPGPTTELPQGARYDHVVIGAGITGLVTAVLLARSGATVAVLEARHRGAVTTGNTTGKVSLLQGTRLSSIASHHGMRAVDDYVTANREGMDWLLRYCADHGVKVDRESAITFAAGTEGAQSVRSEFRVAREAGLDVELIDDTELPFPVQAAVELPDQAQLDPMPLLDALADDLRARGGTIVEGVRVTGAGLVRPAVPRGGDITVTTERGQVTAGAVVVATGMPILDRGGHFARLTAQRSYAGAFEIDEPMPRSMYLGADSPSVSLRYARRADGTTYLLVGGFGHEVARGGSERSHVDDLLTWTRRAFPSARLHARWSAQDYSSFDQMPYVGPILPGVDRVLVATGYAKWGMSNGVAAGLAMSAHLLGGDIAWARSFRSSRPSQALSLPSAASANASVGLHMARGWIKVVTSTDPGTPREGEALTGHRGGRPVASCTVEGTTHTVSPVCPHLYGIVEWNDAEKSWDCPLHGSRFSADGEVLEGPTTSPLRPM